MHVRIKNRTAIIEFEANSDNMVHSQVIEEIVHLVSHQFNKFVFDFSNVKLSFNSTISGFLLAISKKLIESKVEVCIQNIAKEDLEMLGIIGMNDLKEIKYTIRES